MLCTLFSLIYSQIDAFDFDEQPGSISNRRTVVKIDPSHGVSLSLKPQALIRCEISSHTLIVQCENQSP